MSTHSPYCTFFVNRRIIGVPVHTVHEVNYALPLTRVPTAPPNVEGLLNLRGQIVTAFNLRKILLMPPRDPSLPSTNVVVRVGDRMVSFVVDEIGDVEEMDEDRYEETPSTLPPPFRNYVSGIYRRDDGLLLVLNSERATDLGSERPSHN